MTTLRPSGINHLALSTSNMKEQLEYWCDVLGCPLKALYWMHGVENTFHGFVELAADSYVAFVQHPDNGTAIEYAVTHAGNPGAPVTSGAMQHIALHVDTIDEVLAMRDRIRSHGVQVLGPIDHGFCQSIYFAGPEGLALEVACGTDIPAEEWIDPEVRDLCGISDAEVEAFKAPARFDRAAEPVAQPSETSYSMHPATVYAKVMGVPDQVVWDTMSETTPPVQDLGSPP